MEGRHMKWFIVFVMLEADPFAVMSLPFDTQNECKDFINSPVNADRLAIEVIAEAGFEDEIMVVACLPNNKIPKDMTIDT